MLSTFARFDMFAELLKRKHFRSAAAIFIDMVNEVHLLLLAETGPADRELDESRDELSSMWSFAFLKAKSAEATDKRDALPEGKFFHELMEFTACKMANRSDRHRRFYEGILGSEIPPTRTLSHDAVDWFLNTGPDIR